MVVSTPPPYYTEKVRCNSRLAKKKSELESVLAVFRLHALFTDRVEVRSALYNFLSWGVSSII
jgi:hypothetical protein